MLKCIILCLYIAAVYVHNYLKIRPLMCIHHYNTRITFYTFTASEEPKSCACACNRCALFNDDKQHTTTYDHDNSFGRRAWKGETFSTVAVVEVVPTGSANRSAAQRVRPVGNAAERLRSGFRVPIYISYNRLCIIIDAEISRAKCFARPVSYPSYLPNIRSRDGGQKVRTFFCCYSS